VSDLGARTAYKKAPLVKATPNEVVPPGNLLAASCPQGPGGGRDIYRSGFQALSGKVSQGEGKIGGNAGKDILSDFGPEKSRG
jgi:hypothetical protein